MRQRLVILLGSFAFGVAITNAIFLWFLSSGRDDEEQVFAVNLSTSTQQSNSQSYAMTSGLLMLVTVGSGSHAVFDRFVWNLLACSCCRAGGRFESQSLGFCRDLGKYLAIVMVIAVLALATCIVIIRASVEEGQSSVPLFQNQNRTKEDFAQILDFNEFDMQDYSFLRGYAVEFAVSLFVYYPLIETVLFSGILGCFYLPVLGGRPGQMKREAKTQSEVRTVCPTQLT